jgi:Holliday junction resolvasome RuvABC ATP-dependent DNA helicase subunit
MGDRHATCAARDADRVAAEAEADRIARQREAEEAKLAAEQKRIVEEAKASEERRVAADQRRIAEEKEAQWRWRPFSQIVGQQEPIARMKNFAALYAGSGAVAPGHILITGEDGMGKRTLARAFVWEQGVKVLLTEALTLKQSGDLIGILTNLGERDVLVISNVGRLSRPLGEFLASALNDFRFDLVVDKGASSKTINVALKRFTCIATARSERDCQKELREAFHLTIPLQPYSQQELQRICALVAGHVGVWIAPGAAALLASVATGSPHQVEVLLQRLAGTGRSTITEEDAAQLLSVLGLSSALTNGPEPRCVLDLQRLTGVEFEHVIGRLLHSMGLHAEVTKATGDGGIDIIATLDRPIIGGRYLVQCKRLAPDAPVGAATVREFYGAVTADRRAVKGILVTTSGFTAQAREFAQNLTIELVDGEQLARLLAEHKQ